MNCTETRERIVAYRSGWLSPDEQAALAGHLDRCATCRRQLDADARLCEALASLPATEVRVPGWEQVRAAHTAQPPALPRWLLVPAFGAASAAAALLWLVVVGPHASRTPEPVPQAEASSGIARQAHMMMAASDLGGDPNRAIVAWYAGLQSERSATGTGTH